MKRLLFNPGPTNVCESVRNAIRTHDICHREPEFTKVLKQLTNDLVTLVNGAGTHSAVLFVSSGTGCNEAMINGIEGKALVINNGKYSDRLCDILERYRIPYVRLKQDPLLPLRLDAVEEMLTNDPEITHIIAVHHETTTGALVPLRKLGEIAKKHHKLLLVDAVSSLGGHSFDVKADNIAFCTVSANKCLESFPGVSFVIARTEEIEKLKGKARCFYFDLHAQWRKGLSGETPYTPAVQVVFAAAAALKRCLEEGYEQRVSRYRELANRMRDGLRKLGFELLLLPEEIQSNILTGIKLPPDIDYWTLHDRLKESGFTIYSDANVLAQGRFRIATMGSIDEHDVDTFLATLKTAMEEQR